MNHKPIIEKWYARRLQNDNLSEAQKEKLKRLREKAYEQGWTAYKYEYEVRQMLSA